MVTTVARVGPDHHLEKASLCDLSTSHILQTLTACYKPKAIIFSKPSLQVHLVNLQIKLK